MNAAATHTSSFPIAFAMSAYDSPARYMSILINVAGSHIRTLLFLRLEELLVHRREPCERLTSRGVGTRAAGQGRRECPSGIVGQAASGGAECECGGHVHVEGEGRERCERAGVIIGPSRDVATKTALQTLGGTVVVLQVLRYTMVVLLLSMKARSDAHWSDTSCRRTTSSVLSLVLRQL